MGLQIGKVGKLFGLSPETLRYYENEGLLSPCKNPVNGYREYGFQDLLFLTDLLFYRDIGIPIRDIKRIKNGLEINQISMLIDEKKKELQQRIKKEQDSLTKLNNWKEFHTESVEFYGKFDIRPMPVALRIGNQTDNYERSLVALQKKLLTIQDDTMPDDLAFFLTPSFFCQLKFSDDPGQYRASHHLPGESPPPCTRLNPTPSIFRYMVLDTSVTENLSFDYSWAQLAEESAGRCLFTVLQYQDDPIAMLAPLLRYAEEEQYRLSGEIYGRQSINTYMDNVCMEYYRIYAILK